MATKILKSLKGRHLRLTRLDECGAPVVGACSSVVTAGFVTVTWSAELEAGEEYTLKNAWGDLEISEKDADLVKWVNVSMQMCEVHPDVLDIISNMTPVSDGTDTIGNVLTGARNSSAFAAEVWTKQAGAGACSGGSPEWGYLCAPFITNGQIDGDFTVENAPLTLGLKGEAQEATDDWGVNPYGDNPMLAAAGFPVGGFVGVVKTTVQPPAVTDGCAAVT